MLHDASIIGSAGDQHLVGNLAGCGDDYCHVSYAGEERAEDWIW